MNPDDNKALDISSNKSTPNFAPLQQSSTFELTPMPKFSMTSKKDYSYIQATISSYFNRAQYEVYENSDFRLISTTDMQLIQSIRELLSYRSSDIYRTSCSEALLFQIIKTQIFAKLFPLEDWEKIQFQRDFLIRYKKYYPSMKDFSNKLSELIPEGIKIVRSTDSFEGDLIYVRFDSKMEVGDFGMIAEKSKFYNFAFLCFTAEFCYSLNQIMGFGTGWVYELNIKERTLINEEYSNTQIQIPSANRENAELKKIIEKQQIEISNLKVEMISLELRLLKEKDQELKKLKAEYEERMRTDYEIQKKLRKLEDKKKDQQNS